MLDRFKEFWAGTVLHPVVRLFLKLGISPDTVTRARLAYAWVSCRSHIVC